MTSPSRGPAPVGAGILLMLVGGCQGPAPGNAPPSGRSPLAEAPPARTPAPPAPFSTVRSTMPHPALSADAALRQRLHRGKVGRLSFTEESGDLDSVCRIVRTVTDVPILVTPAARRIGRDEALTLVADISAPIAVADLLDLLVGQSSRLAWTVRSGVVQIDTREAARGEARLVVHDVRDLVFPRTEFLPPRIAGIPNGNGIGGRSGSEGDEKVALIEPDALVNTIEVAVGPRMWASEEPSVDYVASGYLLVRASPRMHREIRRAIATLR